MAKYLRLAGLFLIGFSAGMETCVLVHWMVMGG